MSDLKVLYLAAGYGVVDFPGVVYQDKFVKRDIGGDMLEIDFNGFDVILASPPCNFYSKAVSFQRLSNYSLETKHLLPGILEKLEKSDKKYIVENVINKKRMKDIILHSSSHYFEYGRHSYFTNVPFNCSNFQFSKCNINNISSFSRQGAGGVNDIFKYFLQVVSFN